MKCKYNDCINNGSCCECSMAHYGHDCYGNRISLIHQKRAIEGLTQAKLSELSGVPKRTIENWESGTRIPRDVYQIKKIADALNCKIEDIIDFNI